MEQADLNFIQSGYKVEANGLAFISQSELFPQIITAFNNIGLHLAQNKQKISDNSLLNTLFTEKGLIQSKNNSPLLQETFFMSQIACCCELLDNWSLPISLINNNSLLFEYVDEKIASDIKADSTKELQYDAKLHSADTVRFMHILRSLGLFNTQSASCRQLSLGAGTGYKDIYSAHLTPSITTTYNNDTNTNELTFNTQHTQPQHVVLIDNDDNPVVQSKYNRYNANDNNIVALNDTAISALGKTVPELINRGKLLPFNLIMGIRVDHRMIDDIPSFFQLIAQTMEPEADFIMSIGAGFSLEEFQGRLDLMAGIFSYLSSLNLDPVKFELYQGNSLQEWRESPSFGCAAIATHEIVYCKLIRSKIIENS